MSILKPDQGKISRRAAFVLLMLFSVFAYFGLGAFFQGFADAKSEDNIFSFFGIVLFQGFTVAYALSTFIALIFAYLSYKITLAKPKTVDFLIDVETEMRKVAWPIDVEAKNFWDKTQQLRTSSLVVFFVILFLAGSLFVYDTVYHYAFNSIFEVIAK